MKIVIDIPKEIIISLEQGNFGAKYNIYDLAGCLMNGTPLHPNGSWTRRHYINGDKTVDMWVCSHCGEEFSYDAETGASIYDYDYCPNCGQYKRNKAESEE